MNSSLTRKVGLIILPALVGAGIYGGCSGGLGGSLGDFLDTGITRSFFRAIQVDPRSEDSAGPQFVTAEDVNNDGLIDLVSAWNQSQPVQVHLQRRTASGTISFETVTLAGTIPVVSVSGLAVADFDRDGQMDIAVMLKETLLAGAACLDSEIPAGDGVSGLILLYFGPADPTQTNQALAWTEVPVEASRLLGTSSSTAFPEDGGFTSMALGDMDGDGDVDIIAAWNSDCGGETGTADAVLFTNQGPAASRDGTWIGARIPNPVPTGMSIKDVALGDVDQDGDIDIVATFPDAGSMNVRWFRNPNIDIPDDFHIVDGTWQVGTVAQIATRADTIVLGDIDRDDRLDVVARSTSGAVIQWLKGPGVQATTAPLANIPWQVFTLAEFTDRTPEAMALGDLNFDGRLELIAAAEGGVAWFDSQGPLTVFDQWIEHIIIDDRPADGSANDPATTDPNVTPEEIAGTTFMNSILVVDLDGNGANDIVVTLDRSGLSGLSNDALVWFRNTKTPPR